MGPYGWIKGMSSYTVRYVGGPADGKSEVKRAEQKMKLNRGHDWYGRVWPKVEYGSKYAGDGAAIYQLDTKVKREMYRYVFTGKYHRESYSGDPYGGNPSDYYGGCGPDISWS